MGTLRPDVNTVICILTLTITILSLGSIVLGGIAEKDIEIISKNPNNNSKTQKTCGIIPKVKVRNRSRDAGLSSYGQIPWQAGIFHNNENAFICSGALISADTVITSPLCILAVEDYEDLEVRLGDWDISASDSTQETYDHFSTLVEKSWVYPDPDISKEIYPEIVILKLQNPVDFRSYPHVSPICIPNIDNSWKIDDMNFESKCFASGWGSLNRNYSAYHTTQLSLRKHLIHQLTNQHTTKEINRGHQFISIPITSEEEQYNTDSGQLLEEQSNELNVNQSMNLDHKNLSAIPHKNTRHGLAIPDPVEDYMDETVSDGHSWHNNVKNTSSINDTHHSEDQGFKFPFLDSIYPLAEHHETNIYKHKLKYKNGKLITSSRKSNSSTGQSRTKRHRAEHSSTGRKHGRNRKVLYSTHAEPSKTTFLKLFQIELSDKCSHMKSAKSLAICASPANGHFVSFPCMMDLGSPVFCTANRNKDKNESDLLNSLDSNNPKTSGIAYLVGIVSTWTPSCSEVDSHHHNHASSSVGTLILSRGTLKFIRHVISDGIA